MLSWTDILDAEAVGDLVPPAYAVYRPAVVEGLAHFLDGLSPHRTAAILADQAALPADADLPQRLWVFARHCPVLHKLGQVLARDRRLPARLRQVLQTLETLAPGVDLPEALALVEGEIGSLAARGVRLDGPPLAEASVAVVTPFLAGVGAGEPARRGVFKVLKPGVEAALAEDLVLLKRAGAWLDERCRHYGLPDLPHEETFTQVADLLEREVCLGQEQRHLAAAGNAYVGLLSVAIPRVYPDLSSPRLTAMERIDGRKVTDLDGVSALTRQALAVRMVDAVIARPIWSAAPAALFHADPHAGNLMLTPDGRLALLDWSLAATLGKDDRIGLMQILLGAATVNPARVIQAVGDLATAAGDPHRLGQVVDDGLRRLVRGGRLGLGWLTELLDDAVLRAGTRFRGDLLLFRKAFHTVSGVACDISDTVSFDGTMAAAFLTRFGLESGWRAAAPWDSRSFGTHLSNLDLVQAAMDVPVAVVRYWSLFTREALTPLS